MAGRPNLALSAVEALGEDLLFIVGESRHEMAAWKVSLDAIADARLAAEAHLTLISNQESFLRREFAVALDRLNLEEAEAVRVLKHLGFAHLHPRLAGVPLLAGEGEIEAVMAVAKRRAVPARTGTGRA